MGQRKPTKEEIEENPDLIFNQHHHNVAHSKETMIKACVRYLETGSSIKAGEEVGVPHQTIREWKNKSDWWPKVVEQWHIERNEQDIALIKSIKHLSLQDIQDRLLRGEQYVDYKTGKKRRRKMATKDVLAIFKELSQAERLIEGKSTENVDHVVSVEDLKRRFEIIANPEKEEN